MITGRSTLLLALLQLAMVIVLPTASRAQAYTQPLKVDQAKRQWGTPVDNQAISIVSDKAVYQPEEPIILEAILKNVGNEAVYTVEAAAFDIFMYELTVLLPDGEKAPLTLYGKRYCERRGEGSCCTHMLQPGEEKGTQFALSRLFDFSRSGKYTVSIQRTLFTTTMPKVKSNELKITIRDAGSPFYIVRKERDLHRPPKKANKE